MATPSYLLDSTWKLLLSERGIVPEDALRLAGLPEDLFNRASVRLSPEVHDRFIQVVDDLVGDPLLAVWAVDQMQTAPFSPPLFMGLCSPDLRVASQRIAKYKTLIAPCVLSLLDGHELTLRLEWRDVKAPVAPLYIGIEMLFFTKLARLGTRTRVEPLRVQTPQMPRSVDAFETFLGCPIEPGAVLEIVFRAEDAHRSFLTSNPTMWEAFEPQLRKRLAELDAEATYADRTRAVLLECLPAGISDVSTVARRLALSGRTLQRRLQEESTSFKDVVRGLREELARYYLHSTDYSASEIAYLIGFDQPSSFFRAFNEWTGQTPDSFRSGCKRVRRSRGPLQ